MPAAPIPDNEAERLEKLQGYQILDTPDEEAFNEIIELASRFLESPIALVSLVDGNRQWFKAKKGLEVSETSRDYAFCAYPVYDNEVLKVDNALKDERFFDNPLVQGEPNIRAYAGAPLRTSDDFTLGTLCVIDTKERTFTEGDIETLQLLANQVVRVMELRLQSQNLIELNYSIEKRACLLSAIANQSSTDFASLNERITNTLELCCYYFNAELAMIGTVHEDQLEVMASSSKDPFEIVSGKIYPNSETFCIPNDTCIVSFKNDLDATSSCAKHWHKEYGYKSCLWFPLDLGQRTSSSLFLLYKQKRNKNVSPEEQSVIQLLARWISSIYEQNESQMQLQTLNFELTRSNEELENFAYIASHDLKSPLRAIRKVTEWIEEDEDTKLSNYSKERFALLKNRISRLDMLLESLLLYSRAGQLEKTVVEVKLSELLQTIGDSLSHDKKIRIHIPEQLPSIKTSRPALDAVLRNLIDNAIKHHHGPQGNIWIQVEELTEHIIIDVKDDGPGIPERFHEKIFCMFETLKSRDALDSSGMGLAIVKKTLESFGGSISVESTVGVGTLFRVIWPRTLKSSDFKSTQV